MIGHIDAFQPGGGPVWDEIGAAPEPDFEWAPALPEREWGLSAGQVVAVVIAILVVCEVIGLIS